MLEELRKYLEPYPEGLGVVIEKLDSGERLNWHAGDRFPSASLIKLPIMYCFLELVSEGKENLEDIHVLRENDKVGESVYDTGILRDLHEGIGLTLEDCMRLMIDISDDTATNLIMKRMSFSYMNENFIRYGLHETMVGRYMMEYDGVQKGRDNFTSAKDTNVLLKLLLEGTYLSGKCKELALDVLMKQRENDGLNKYLPQEIVYAHKCGCIKQYQLDHECGILYKDGNPFLLFNFCSCNISDSRKLMNQLGKEIYNMYYS
ncbi:class A beta-lactamase-related serine hydrolase [Kineothrix sp. MSJ-39]|uniref:serine hydrolase n=1 Tax=Kineothrix sp. MSJ-39 TaxID=2841533 RepID=UPI001C120646|nr:serine hydrolase [Kineothrix sp. MSJ-39]MBU5430128.1 class A beta-lactamase-related serine hydrolase [Kineothrix sp. MSJ-39]